MRQGAESDRRPTIPSVIENPLKLRGGFGALVRGKKSFPYAARTRNGFTPASRALSCLKSSSHWKIEEFLICEPAGKKAGRWGCWADRSQNGGVPVAQARARRAI